jgi:hypothetical protein
VAAVERKARRRRRRKKGVARVFPASGFQFQNEAHASGAASRARKRAAEQEREGRRSFDSAHAATSHVRAPSLCRLWRRRRVLRCIAEQALLALLA